MSFLPVGHQEAQSSQSPQPCRKFSVSDIQTGTQNFSELFVIGHGGSSKVYKGTISVGENYDLLDVAIKRLQSSSCLREREFRDEVYVLYKLRHGNLVSLIGYCNDGQERIIVSEYMPNGTFSDRLHKRIYPPLTFVRRLKILIGAACGLLYLHTNGVIHHDMKPENILLSKTWVAKICDFGMSRTGPTNRTSDSIKGTPGFVDPDYVRTGFLTQKSDVYACGMTMLEALCGKKAIEERFDNKDQWILRECVQECIANGTLNQIVDSNLSQGAGAISIKCANSFAQLALLCLDTDPNKRPTMAEVVAGLESILASQEKANRKCIKSMKNKIFGIRVPSFITPFKREKNSGLKSLEFHLYTVGGENRILHRFDINTINVATGSFSIANIISDNEFGTMYKGRLPNDQDIAIYGPSSDTQYELYKNEASILVSVEHENLIQFIGYCIEGMKVYLVYAFAPYATLDCLLFDHSRAPLDWDQRYNIILGVARVLLYLHKHAPTRVIHSNVQPHNIILDESLNPKLSGFYFARSTETNEPDCIRMDIPRWNMGYLAPEHLSIDPMLSTMCDVFSLGVLILESITGQKGMLQSIGSSKSLEEYVQRNWLEGTISDIIDPRMNVDSSLMKRIVMIGLLCTKVDAEDRPAMNEVVDMLTGNSSSDALLSEIRAMDKQGWEMKVKTIKKSRVRSNEESASRY